MDTIPKSEEPTTTSGSIPASSRVRIHITVEESERIKADAKVSWALRKTIERLGICKIELLDQVWYANRMHMMTFMRLKD